MKGSLMAWLPAVLALSLVSCAKPSQIPFERSTVQLHLVSDPNLNLYGGIPHSLVLCVHQLREPNYFNQTKDEKDGLGKLLDCSRSDPSVTYARSFSIQPRQELNQSLDRAEGTWYVGIVAGYSQLQKERVTRLYEIPLSSLFNKPQTLSIDLYLGPQEIQEPRGNK